MDRRRLLTAAVLALLPRPALNVLDSKAFASTLEREGT